jgi:hypothetical protein
MIQIPVLVFARYLRNRRVAGLKQVKHAEKQENQIPFKYYRSALAAITRHHRSGNDPAVLKKAQAELAKKLATCEKPGRAVILRNNLRAIAQYRTHFGNRNFEVLPVPKLKILAESVVVSAKVDLYVIENGQHLLVKLDMCKGKKNESETQSLLAITSEAAEQEQLAIEASNVLLLRLEDGSELRGRELRAAEIRDIQIAGLEIEKIWDSL